MVQKVRIQLSLFVLAGTLIAAGLASTAALARAKVADKRLAKDAATWKELLTDKDLEAILAVQVTELKKVVKSKGTFNAGAKKALRAAHVVAALGNIGTMMMDKDAAAKAAALRDAGLALAKATKDKRFDDAKQALAAVEGYPKKIEAAAAVETGKWLEVIPLHELMENVNSIDTDMRKAIKTEAEFKKSAKELGARTQLMALLAVIAREHETKADWQNWCDDMRQGSIDLSRQFKAKSHSGAKQANEALQKTCTDCHKIYQDKESEK